MVEKVEGSSLYGKRASGEFVGAPEKGVGSIT